LLTPGVWSSSKSSDTFPGDARNTAQVSYVPYVSVRYFCDLIYFLVDVESMGRHFDDVCNYLFKEAQDKFGQIWHIYTPGNLTEILNVSNEDFRFGVSNMAISSYEAGLRVITDVQMANHMHSLVAGTLTQCATFMEGYRYRYGKYLERIGRYCDLSKLKCDKPILIENLDMLRTEIVYINRNGYVADSHYLPYSYPWGGGSLYFNPYAKNCVGTKYNELPFRTKRLLCCKRVTKLPESYMVNDGMILPASYVDYHLGESLFRGAHHYLSEVTRKYEAYSKEAKQFGDTVILSNEELFQVIKMMSIRDFNIKQPSLLPPQAKLEIARIMHNDYNATNAQIRMILKITEDQISSLFPKPQ